MVRAQVVTAVLAVALSPIAAAPPTSGEQVVVHDGSGSTAPSDVLRAMVRHRDDRVRVRITVADLRSASAASATAEVFYDTRPDRRVPEFVLHVPLDRGDYGVSRVRNWQSTHRSPAGRVHVGIDTRRDVVRTWVGREVVGRPGHVRVALRTVDDRGEDGIRADWLTGRRQLTPWLDRS